MRNHNRRRRGRKERIAMSENAIETQRPLPLSLPELAAEANRRHRLCEESCRSALEHAWHAGTALAEAKGQVGHGGWLSWLEENFAAGRSTAYRYMAVAENFPRVGNLPDAMSLRGALREI